MGKYSCSDTFNCENAFKNPLVNLIHVADMCSVMVEKTVDYKEMAIKEYIKKLTGN